jgi:hypothetical protein
MANVCPSAAVFWWSGDTRRNQRGCLMAYLPTTVGLDDANKGSPRDRAILKADGHTGWYAEFKKVDEWRVANALCTTAQELSSYAASVPAAS